MTQTGEQLSEKYQKKTDVRFYFLDLTMVSVKMVIMIVCRLSVKMSLIREAQSVHLVYSNVRTQPLPRFAEHLHYRLG